jgi:hypothetical protein
MRVMRCPSCRDEFEPHMTWCGTCRVDLVPDGAPDPPTPPGVPDTRLGVFHPTMGAALLAELSERGTPYETVTRDGGLEIVVPRVERDDLRAELSVDWGTRVAELPEEERSDVRWQGGEYPGWLDPPEGGWIDRDGRLVVDARDDEEADASRTLGPLLAVVGVCLLLLTWYLGLGMGPAFAGVGLLLFGLLVPR